MTRSAPAGPAAVLGHRRPRILAQPPWASTSGPEACDLLRSTGQIPDPWQEDAVAVLLAEQADGRPAARRTGMIAARQNGKGGVIEPIELHGMFTAHEHILHSAHQFDTARDAFDRLRELVESTPDLLRRVKRINEAHGKEGIELSRLPDGRPGGSIRFHARTKRGGRGKSPQRIVLDEAFAVTREQMAALLPAISAQAEPQINFFSTPPPVGEAAPVLTRMRRSALAALREGRAPQATWIEWGAPRKTAAGKPTDITDPVTWAMANPALGIRITIETILDELDALEPPEFGAERCGIWPDDGEAQWLVISEDDWLAACDPESRREGPVALCIEVSPDGAWTSIGAGGLRADGLRHGELVEHRPGTGWVLPWAVERHRTLKPCAWVIDPSRPAAALIPALEAAKIPLVKMTVGDAAAACGGLKTGLCDPDPTKRDIRIRTERLLSDCMAGAVSRDLGTGGRWAFDSRVDLPLVSPVIAVTNALWGRVAHPPVVRQPMFAFA